MTLNLDVLKFSEAADTVVFALIPIWGTRCDKIDFAIKKKLMFVSVLLQSYKSSM
jgi:hypothetical protein